MAIFCLIAVNNPIGYVPGVMSVYREHQGGTTKSANHTNQLSNQRIIMLKLLDKHFQFKYTRIIKKTIDAFKNNHPVKMSIINRIKNKFTL